MRFVKMHGCANDFVVTHEVRATGMSRLREQVVPLCDRRRGIGADGVILIQPSAVADLRMRIFNADGSEAEMCGNGIRCALLYARMKGLAPGATVSFETGAGMIEAEVRGELIRVDMGAPVLSAPEVPTTQTEGTVVDKPIAVDGRTFAVTAVSMGNPHAVIFVDDLSDDLVLRYGPLLERHPFFPRKANVEFVTKVTAEEVRMRVYERGVGETHACGTGACAVGVAGVVTGRTRPAVTVHLTGGDLHIEWKGSPGDHVFMTGPAVAVYEGDVSVGF